MSSLRSETNTQTNLDIQELESCPFGDLDWYLEDLYDEGLAQGLAQGIHLESIGQNANLTLPAQKTTPARKIPDQAKASEPDYKIGARSTPKRPKTKAAQKMMPEKKTRNRRKDPSVKVYVKVTDRDVLFGRGGESNHHPGNKVYLKYILDRQSPYKTLPRKEKTAMSQQVVDLVHGRKGRFLKPEKETGRYFVVTEKTARDKVSQALREDHTPEGRALKKSKTKRKAKVDHIQRVQIHFIEPIDEMPVAEREATWYNQSEYKEIQNSNKKEIRMIETNEPLCNTKYCARGLERYTKLGSMQKTQKRGQTKRKAKVDHIQRDQIHFIEPIDDHNGAFQDSAH